MSSFSLGLWIVFTVVEEHKAEKEDTSNHAESAGVVRIGTDDESFVLRVLKRSNRYLQQIIYQVKYFLWQEMAWWNYYLSGAVEEGVTNPCVINFELVNTINIRDSELSAEESVIATLKKRSHKRIDTNKFELNILGVERSPLSLFKLFNFDGIDLWLTK